MDIVQPLTSFILQPGHINDPLRRFPQPNQCQLAVFTLYCSSHLNLPTNLETDVRQD
jgi:hypothetical protein